MATYKTFDFGPDIGPLALGKAEVFIPPIDPGVGPKFPGRDDWFEGDDFGNFFSDFQQGGETGGLKFGGSTQDVGGPGTGRAQRSHGHPILDNPLNPTFHPKYPLPDIDFDKKMGYPGLRLGEPPIKSGPGGDWNAGHVYDLHPVLLIKPPGTWPPYDPPPGVTQSFENCTREAQRLLRVFHNELFIDGVGELGDYIRRFPPQILNCLIEVWKNILFIECTDDDKKPGAFIDKSRQRLIINFDTPSNWKASLLKELITRMFADTSCGNTDVWLMTFIAIQWRAEEGVRDKSWEGWFNDMCKSYKSNNDPIVKVTGNVILVDARTGDVYANPFYPNRAPEGWNVGDPAPNPLKYLFRADMYKCK